jgi:drug/metabolite transporter, DME family
MRAFTSGPAAARRRPATGLLYLVISGLLWGTGGLTGSLLGRVAGLSPIAVAACRLTAGGVLIVGYLTATRRPWPSGRAAWARIAVIGLLAASYQSCYFTAVSLTSVPLATLITIGAAPVIVLGAERAIGRPAGRLAVLTTGLAVTGLGLLVGLPSGFRESAVLASAGMAVLAAAGFAAMTLVSTRPVAGLDDLAVAGFGFTIGGLLLMPLAWLAGGGITFRPGLAAIGLLVALGTGPTAVAYTLYFRGLRTVAASTAARLTLLEPLTGAILAALLLGERLSATGIAGAAIIGAAVILTVQADRGGALRGGDLAPEGADRVGGDDGGDAQPGLRRQGLTQDHHADERGEHRVDAGKESPRHGSKSQEGWRDHPASLQAFRLGSDSTRGTGAGG